MFEHEAKKADKDDAAGQSWQVAGGKKRKRDKRGHAVLRVHSRGDVHCGRWRSLLQELDEEAAALSSWVSREGDWYVLHARTDDVADLLARLKPLRKLKMDGGAHG